MTLVLVLAGSALYFSCNRGTSSSGEIDKSIVILPFDATDDQARDTSQWRPLFNGTDLTGWKHAGQGSMSVEDGLIRGHGGMGLLYWAGEKFGNCKIRVVFKMEKENSNSGVFVRVPIEPYEEWMAITGNGSMPALQDSEMPAWNHPSRDMPDPLQRQYLWGTSC